MDEHKRILKRVGVVLTAVGVLDIAYMVYCITHGRGYSSSFNILAVAAGLFLWRGNLAAARVVEWLTAFLLAGFLTVFLTFPFLRPLDLWAAEFQADPVGLPVSLVVGAALLVLLFWVYRRLREAPVLQARTQAGQRAAPPRLAFAVGIVLALFAAGSAGYVAYGPAGRKAVALARARHGDAYRYYVTALSWSGGHVSARLDAYNAHGLRQVAVAWNQ